jgi:hypothetical protein
MENGPRRQEPCRVLVSRVSFAFSKTRICDMCKNLHDHGSHGRTCFIFHLDREIGFFDFYIIPLAKKLKDCGVFGVSSDEVRKLLQCVFMGDEK